MKFLLVRQTDGVTVQPPPKQVSVPPRWRANKFFLGLGPRLSGYWLVALLLVIAASGCSPDLEPPVQPAATTGLPPAGLSTASPTLLPAPKPTATASAPGNTPDDTGSIQAEEYQVYAAVIQGMYLSGDIQQVVVTSETGISPSREASASEQSQYLTDSMGEKLAEDTLQDYVAKNDQIYELKEKIPVEATVVYLDRQSFDEIFQSENGWEQFYQIYPGSQGILTFSRVGFSAARDQALVYAGNQQNYLAGRGNYILLAKRGGHWEIEEVLMAWIS